MSGHRDMSGAIERVRAAAADEAERVLCEAASLMDSSAEAFAAVEKAVRDGVQRIGGGILHAAIALAGNGYQGASRRCRCGGWQKYMNDRERRVVSLVGEFRMERAYYWCGECGDSGAPLDERLGISRTEFSPAVREAVSLVGAEVPFGRGAMLMRELTGLPISKRKHREISERTGTTLGPATPSVDHPARNGAVEDLYISTDGTHAPTREGWREVKVGAVFHARPRRRPKGTPQRLHTHYLADIMNAEEFGWQLYRAAEGMGLEQAPRTIVLGDGAAWIWNMAALHFPDAIQIVDWYHAVERLWIVANAFFGEATPEAHAWVARCEKHLRASRVEAVITELRRLSRSKRKARKIIHEAMGYYRNNAERMRYRRYLRRGLFISSGVVEAGCKHIVARRLKESGMRWDLDGMRSILYLRLAVLNGQWPAPKKKAA